MPDGGMLEQIPHREFFAKLISKPGNQAGGDDGLPSQADKVGVDGEVAAVEHFLPDRNQSELGVSGFLAGGVLFRLDCGHKRVSGGPIQQQVRLQ